jgi:hypothetical protein
VHGRIVGDQRLPQGARIFAARLEINVEGALHNVPIRECLTDHEQQTSRNSSQSQNTLHLEFRNVVPLNVACKSISGKGADFSGPFGDPSQRKRLHLAHLLLL